MNVHVSRRGFTLIETAIVLIIIGTIAAILLPALVATVKRGKMTEAREMLHTVRDEIIGYAEQNDNTLSDDLEALGNPSDPWGRRFAYRIASDLNGTSICGAAAINGMEVVLSGEQTVNATAFVLSSDGPDHVRNVQNMESGGGTVNATDCEDDLFLHVGLYHLQAILCPPLSLAESNSSDEPLTSLGSTFSEISSAMIDLIQDFYDENGSYPRSWGDYRYTDIGLDPGEWDQGYEGIIYTPTGNRLQVEPDDGYMFYVTDLDGVERSLASSLNWALMYSMDDDTWYYHTIEMGNEIDISTLRVEAD